MTLEVKGQSPYARLVLVGIDQLIAATNNFMVVWLCLTSLPTEAFGSFSYSWSMIALFVVLSRSLFGIPALLDSESDDPGKMDNMSSSLTGALVLGVLTSIVTLALYLLGGASENEIWILGLFLIAPLMIFQDQIRYLLIASKRLKFAILLDLLVFSCIVVSVITAKYSEFVGWIFILGLAFGYLLASSIFVFTAPIQLSVRNLRLFMRLDFYRRSRLVSDAFLAWGFGLIAITLIRVAIGDSGVAIYNGLVFLFGPVAFVTVVLTLGLQSEVVRTNGNLATRHKAWLVLVSMSPVIWIILVNQVPERYVVKLLGQSTQEILANLIPFGIAASLGIGIEVLNLFMRARKKFGQIARLRLGAGLTLTLLLTMGIYSNSGLGDIIWALAFTSTLAILGTAVILRKEQINREPR